MSLHDKIMNLPTRQVSDDYGCQSVYAEGHRDARHAAAELAAEQDATIEQLVKALSRVIASHRDYTEWQERGLDITCPPSLDWSKEIEAAASAALAAAKEQQ